MPALITLPDVLSWCDDFELTTSRSAELQFAQKMTLLQRGARGGITRDGLLAFLAEDQHQVRPEVVDMMIDELGEDGRIGKEQLWALIGTGGPPPWKTRVEQIQS